MWKQKIPFNLAKMGHRTGYCLQNVRLGFGLPANFGSAKEDYQYNKNKNAIHDILTVPLNCSVPVYADTANPNEHILISVNGKFYSDGVLINKDKFKYFGWGEYCEGEKVVEYIEGEEDMKVYKNGSTVEKVYADSNCLQQIGSLNPYEQCECYGLFSGRAVIRYRIDGTTNYKVGFVKWIGGIK